MEAGVASLFSLHAIASFQKQMHIAKLVGKLDWGFAMDSGLLSFSGKHHFAAQVLGTESEGAQTWLWSWAPCAMRSTWSTSVTTSAMPSAVMRCSGGRASTTTTTT